MLTCRCRCKISIVYCFPLDYNVTYLQYPERSGAMPHYSDFGFVNTQRLFSAAVHAGFAIPAFNFVCLEQMLAIVDACVEAESPFILQSSAHVRKAVGAAMTRRMSQACAEIVKESGANIEMALHLDHGTTFEDCKSCVDDGYSSVMIDGSALPFEQNAELTKKVADYARTFGVSVEGELGAVPGAEDGVSRAGGLTDPDEALRFVELTGVDSLAVSVGTCHGLNKRGNVKPGETVINFERLAEIAARLPDFPLVLHGASEILPKYIEMIERGGGSLRDSAGIPAEELRRAARTTICKINVASDGWVAATAAVRTALAADPGIADPRKFLTPAREEMRKLYLYKIESIMNSGKRGRDA